MSGEPKDNPGPWSDSAASARLISAAPDLLAALKIMLEGGLEGPTPQAIETALAAIAKAEPTNTP